jgi:hypothetical protein
MGCQSDPNHGLLMRAIVHLLGLMKADAEEAEEFGLELDANNLWKVGVYFCVLTAASLRGHKGFYLELAGVRKHLAKGKQGEVPLGLDKSTILTEEKHSNLPHVTVGTLQNGYIQNVPLPRVALRVQSASHVMSHGAEPRTCYSQVPRVPSYSEHSRLLTGLGGIGPSLFFSVGWCRPLTD